MAERTDKEVDRTFAPRTDEALGEVRIDGRAFVLIERETLAEIQREIEAVLGRGVEGILVRAGYSRGAPFAVRLSSLVAGKTEAFLDGLRVFTARTGLCRIEDVRIEQERVTIRVRNSFLGISYGKSKSPVCHYLRGLVLAAGETLLHRKALECRETSCVAVGGGACVFEVVPVPGSSGPWGEYPPVEA